MESSSLNIKVDNKNELDSIQIKKMLFIYNALNKGWSVTKNDKSYTFSKEHNNDKKVFYTDFLSRFMKENFENN